MAEKKIKTFYAKNRTEWREWLRKNHETEKKIYLIRYKKHTKKPSLNSKEAMEEAICFGWIDTVIKRIDDETFCQCFVKRTKNSRWSNNTLSYAKKLIQEKKMTQGGMREYIAGLKKPVIDHGLPKNPKTPQDLQNALEKNEKAKENFNNFAPSYKQLYIYWIEKAKKEETRNRRITEVVKRAEQNKKTQI